MPAFLNSFRKCRALELSSSKALSVNSTINASGGSLAFSSSAEISCITSDFSICICEILMLTWKSGIVSRIFLHACRASLMIQRPAGMMSPLSSRIGINSAGEIVPNCPEEKRIKVSAPKGCLQPAFTNGCKATENPRKSCMTAA